MTAPPLIDPQARRITYLRVSVTDRCDFRCLYCMAEDMTFLPRADLLTLDELDRVASAFVRRGVRKLRLTGGEPLVRRNVMELFRGLGRHLKTGALDEVTLTTNGSQLARFADDLRAAGVRRINVSLDTLDPVRFKAITRRGDLGPVMDGLRAAREAGIAVKINTVALKGFNEDELPDLMVWAHSLGFAITFIETMPMGDIDGDRTDHYLPLTEVRARLEQRFGFDLTDHRSGGPARYARVSATGGLVGFITPLSDHFCDDCNRVRLTCTGKLYLCLGQEDAADLRAPLRAGVSDRDFDAVLDAAIARKPKGHDFMIDRYGSRGTMPRHMSVTGG